MSLAPKRPGNFPYPVPDSAGIPKVIQDTMLVAPVRVGPEVVVVSEENVLGVPGHVLTRTFYPLASQRIGRLASLSLEADLRCFLSIRSQDRFLPSAYAEALKFAPGHRHLRIARSNGQPVAVLDDSAPVHFCKPAVDILFSSAAEVFGAAVLGLVLTGMGTDGTRGGADIVAAGGGIIAQDEPTSIVWGMPGAVAQAGLCCLVLPLPDIAPAITRAFGRHA